MGGFSVHSQPLAGGARGGAGARQRAGELEPQSSLPESQESHAPARGGEMVSSIDESATESKTKLRMGQEFRPKFFDSEEQPM
jgi:hypothetical protein